MAPTSQTYAEHAAGGPATFFLMLNYVKAFIHIKYQ